MKPSLYNAPIDIKSTYSNMRVVLGEGFDAQYLCFSLYDGTTPYIIEKDCLAVLRGVKADGNPLENICTISNNKIYYKVTKETVSCPGEVRCELTLYGLLHGAVDSILISPNFILKVNDRIDVSSFVSEGERTAFDAIMLEEVGRKNAETERIANETARVEAETKRGEDFESTVGGLLELGDSLIEEENKRVAWEQERWEAEAQRQNNENERIANENERIANEDERKLAESARVGEENRRITRFAGMESDMQKHLKDLDSRYRLGTQEMVNKWLDEHPEATTTVEPHSLDLDHFVFGSLGYVTPQMFGAKGDGKTDDTKAIQYALDFAYENNIGVVYIPNGVYMINGIETTNNQSDLFDCGLIIHSNTTLIMDNECILKLIPNGFTKSCVLRCEYNAKNIGITGGQIYGDREEHTPINPNYLGEHGMGIYLGGNKNVKISNCRISNCWGDGIIVTLNDKFDTPSRNILVDNVRIDNARRNGISLVGVLGFTLSNSVIDGTGSTVGKYDGTFPKSAIDIEPSPYEWNTNEDLLITNCRMSNSAGYGLVSVKTSEILSKNLTVENCIFEGNATGFNTDISNLILRDSVFRNNEYSGISLGAGENCIVSNCLSYENEIGLVITSHMKGVVEGCVFSNNRKKTNDGVSGSGLVVNGCNEGRLTIKNCICDNNELYGMKLHTTHDLGDKWYADYDTFYSASLPIIISECTCNNNVSSGIYLIRHCKTNVSNCVLCNNGAYGIFVHNLCDDTLVTGCYLEGNYVGNASGANLACYGNNNSRLTNNTIRLGITELDIAGIVVGYYSQTTENTFITDNDVRGFNTGKDIWQVQDTNTIFGKNIKSDGTYA